MNNYIKGSIREIFFKNEKGFMVGIFKVRDTNHEDLNDYLNKTITFTGLFQELREDADYVFYGNIVTHPKYGFQYKVDNYEKIMPETKNGIISFLSSGIFPKVGLKTATNIVDKMGENALDLIIDNYKNLLLVPSITEKRALGIYEILIKEVNSYKIIIYLQKLGFTMNEASKIYNQYKDNTSNIIENNIYQIIEDVDGIGFLTIDKIASNQNIGNEADKRVIACILYIMTDYCIKSGNTYVQIDKIYNGVCKYLDNYIESESFNYYLLKLNEEQKIIIEDDRYYLVKIYEAEKNNAKRIVDLCKKELPRKANIDGYIEQMEKGFGITFNDKQKMAIKYSYDKNFLVITGGPGTGKTTIIKAIVELYKALNKLTDDRMLSDVILLAPTGRAAKRIREATIFPAMTIHKFLKWNKETNDFGVNEFNKADVKFVIIDEVSMIDNILLNKLFNGLKSDIKLILVGDHNQLPSVGPGQILKDIIESDVVPVVELSDLYRQQDKSYIISLAYEINSGNLSKQFEDKHSDYSFIESRPDEIRSIIIEICKKAIDKNLSYKDIQILIPMYKGTNGIDNMNNILQNIFNPKDKSKKEFIYQETAFREGDKVLQIKNNSDLNISNGDIGIIDSIINVDGKDKIIIDYDGDLIEYGVKEIEDVKLGYAISIHKSQGSEFDIVIIPMDLSYSRMLYRKLIYTAVTRTKKSLIMVGEKEAFYRSINNVKEETRLTTLKLFINNLNNYE